MQRVSSLVAIYSVVYFKTIYSVVYCTRNPRG